MKGKWPAAKTLLSLWEGICEFLFVSQCVHCGDFLHRKGILCSSCTDLLEKIDARALCPYCASYDCGTSRQKRKHCLSFQQRFLGVSTVFSYEGPIRDMIKLLKYGGQRDLGRTLGAYMAVRYCELDWPQPDYIISVPQTLSSWVVKGFSHSAALAEGLGECIGVPSGFPLQRREGAWPHARLSRTQRRQLSIEEFSLQREERYWNKIFLLVDDILTTGTTLQVCADVLEAYRPKGIYALTLCSSEEQ